MDVEQNRTTQSIWVRSDYDWEPHPLTDPEGVAFCPRWSPDGSQLAFVSDRDGDTPQLHVLNLKSGSVRTLTSHEDGIGECAWSPDGRYLAYNARVPDPSYAEKDPDRRDPRRITTLFYQFDGEGWTFDRPRQIFVVELESGQSRQLSNAGRDHNRLAWRPDSQAIAYVAAPSGVPEEQMARVLFTIDLDGSITQLTNPETGVVDSPSWSPDGRWLAHRVSPMEGFREANVAVLDVETGRTRVLTEALDRNCRPFTTSELREQVWVDAETLVFGVEDAGRVHLYSVIADGSARPEPVVTGELTVTGFDAARGRLVYTASTPARPSELFVDGDRLTSFSDRAGEFYEPVRFAVESPAGGEIDAWLVLPPDNGAEQSRPLIMSVHGGPLWQWTGFWPEFHILAEAGYAVVYANPHGSSGKGRDWAGAIRGPNDEGGGWGSADFDDLLAVIDAALERWPSLDPDRIGIMGQSYGGYMAAWAVGQTDRFAAAWAENPVVNLVSAVGTADVGTILPRWIGELPYANEEALAKYWRSSPLSHVQNVTTPVMIVHSTEDLRCPFGQAQELFAALRFLDREAELLVFPGPHDFALVGSPTHQVLRSRELLDWWARHLQPAPTTTPGGEQALAT